MAKIQNHLNASQQAKKSQKFDSNEIQLPPKYVKCKTKQKETLAWFLCLQKKQSVLLFPRWSLKEMTEDTGEQTPSFFIYQELLKWKLLPWIINSTQGIQFCSLYILSIVDLCWGTNQETKPGLSSGHGNYSTEDKGDLFSWLVIKLMLAHRHYFCLLEFVGLTQTHRGRLGLVSKSNFI